MTTSPPPFAGVILAAGQGTRMVSDLPKVLHPVCGLPMVEWVVRAMRDAGCVRLVVVIGNGADLVKAALAQYEMIEFVEQTERLGTGHAVMVAAPLFADWQAPVVVSAGDTPLLRADTIARLVREKGQAGAALTTCVMDDPGGYGRIVRDAQGEFQEIVEVKNATPDQLKLKEWNPALYAFDNSLLQAALPKLSRDNPQGEYLLTDILGILKKEGHAVAIDTSRDVDEFLGVNDRWQLAEVAAIAQERILRHHCRQGVSIQDPASTRIEADVQIGKETVILPNTVIDGTTTIGEKCSIGPSTWIKSSTIGDSCRVFMSHLDQARMDSLSRCGPFSNLRPGAHLMSEAKIGNFVEIKNSILHPEVSVSHLTYIGDAEIGARTNIGAGTITCNYDGVKKHKTVIGADAFIGSNSTLVAPVTIGDETMVAAGSVVTKDVAAGDLAIGRGRQENKEQWYRRWRKQISTAETSAG